MSEETQQKSIAFLPWLNLPEPIQAGSVRFVPYTIGHPAPESAELDPRLKTILSSYRDIAGKPIVSCTLAFLEGKKPGDDLSEEEQRIIQKATAFLYFASTAKNDYCYQPGAYVNNSLFQLIFQTFSDSKKYLGFYIPRRDGFMPSFGYQHGKIYFTMPVQCSSIFKMLTDEEFLKALVKADANNLPTIQRLLPILPFFRLANMDDNTPQDFEIILMGAAFEQLLDAECARDFQKKLGALLQRYGSITVDSALNTRPGMKLDMAHEPYQRQWFVHRKWAEELHNLRSVLIHGENIKARAWGWSLFEHLLMGAFIFPLIVKLILAQEGYYSLSDADHSQCIAVDWLLYQTDWPAAEDTGSNYSIWRKTIFNAKHSYFKEKLLNALESGSYDQ